MVEQAGFLSAPSMSLARKPAFLFRAQTNREYPWVGV
jgi:hypothetical protein